MKNVAGYDVSRLMAGALGTLGVLLEVSLKVLPKAEIETSRLFQCSPAEALDKLHDWSQTPLPISASSYHGSTLRVRLSGATNAVRAAIETIGGDTVTEENYWYSLKEQELEFFTGDKPLWRISMASDSVSLGLPADYSSDDCLYEWGGALRWLKGDIPVDIIQDAAAAVNGHASLFRHKHQGNVFQPLTPGLLRIHKNLKMAFDPGNILNPGRLYPEL
jgi:glycolate oxidase FAD binding subunit